MPNQPIDPSVYDLYDEYCHGRIDRREFFRRAAAITVGGASALAMAEALLPSYAEAQTISFTDERMKGLYVEYPSPGGNSGRMRGYLATPAGAGPFPAVLVIHENRGLNPYIEDVARRAAVAGFLALAPDGLAPVGGYPGNDDAGPGAAGEARPGEAATGHDQQRAVPEGARPVERQARRRGLLLGRRHGQPPRRGAGSTSCRRASRSTARPRRRRTWTR
jgi:hypothetical protein